MSASQKNKHTLIHNCWNFPSVPYSCSCPAPTLFLNLPLSLTHTHFSLRVAAGWFQVFGRRSFLFTAQVQGFTHRYQDRCKLQGGSSEEIHWDFWRERSALSIIVEPYVSTYTEYNMVGMGTLSNSFMFELYVSCSIVQQTASELLVLVWTCFLE